MKRTILIIGLLSLAAILLSSCDIGDGSGFSSFNYSLRGTWETQPDSFYDAAVEIDYNTIKITGIFRPSPLSNFTSNSLLKGYSEETTNSYALKEGLIYIQDKGTWQTPIQYRYGETAFPENAKRLTLLPSNITLFFKEH